MTTGRNSAAFHRLFSNDNTPLKERLTEQRSILDNSSITMNTNLSSVHTLKNYPTLVTGGGADINHGRHLVMDGPKTPLCNLWLSLLKGTGIQADSHGDSTGKIDQLFNT